VLDYVLDYVSASKVCNRELLPFGYLVFKEENWPIEDVVEGEEEEDDPKYACENEYGIGP